MRGPKVARHCDGCRQPKRARWRTLVDRYLCEPCYRTPPVVVVDAGHGGQSVTVDGMSVPTRDEPEFDLSHLTGGKR